MDAPARLALSAGLSQLRSSVEKSGRSDGSKRWSVPREQVVALNAKAAKPRRLESETEGGKGLTEETEGLTDELVFGDAVLDLVDHSTEFNVFFPFRRGDINLHPGIG